MEKFLANFHDFYQAHSNGIVIGGSGIAVIFLGFLLAMWESRRDAKNSSRGYIGSVEHPEEE